MRVAIVGAGMAGLACALRLEAAGIAVTVFDKGRRAGGRMASRRLDGALFDHGAQFVSAKGPDLAAALAEWSAAGVAALWPAASSAGSARFVGVASMATIPAHLAGRLTQPAMQARQVGQLVRSSDFWHLRHHDAADIRPGSVSSQGGDMAGPFDAVLLTAPAPQTAALLRAARHGFADAAATARYAPCWAVMASFANPLDLPDVGREGAGAIAWTARESSRPGRAATPERFVIHASAAWSQDWLERDEPDARAALLAAFPSAEPPVAALAHRWRYAKVEHSLATPCLWDPAGRIGAAGDWCLGGRVEAAWDSGRALANAVLASL